MVGHRYRQCPSRALCNCSFSPRKLTPQFTNGDRAQRGKKQGVFGDVSNLTKLDADRGSYAAKPEDRRLMETGPSQNLSHRSFTYWRKFDPKRSLKRTWIDDCAHHRKSFEQYQCTRLPRRRRSRAEPGAVPKRSASRCGGSTIGCDGDG